MPSQHTQRSKYEESLLVHQRRRTTASLKALRYHDRLDWSQLALDAYSPFSRPTTCRSSPSRSWRGAAEHLWSGDWRTSRRWPRPRRGCRRSTRPTRASSCAQNSRTGKSWKAIGCTFNIRGLVIKEDLLTPLWTRLRNSCIKDHHFTGEKTNVNNWTLIWYNSNSELKRARQHASHIASFQPFTVFELKRHSYLAKS